MNRKWLLVQCACSFLLFQLLSLLQWILATMWNSNEKLQFVKAQISQKSRFTAIFHICFIRRNFDLQRSWFRYANSKSLKIFLKSCEISIFLNKATNFSNCYTCLIFESLFKIILIRANLHLKHSESAVILLTVLSLSEPLNGMWIGHFSQKVHAHTAVRLMLKVKVNATETRDLSWEKMSHYVDIARMEVNLPII